MKAAEEKQNPAGPLAYWLAAGQLEARLVLPAIRALAGQGAQPKPLLAILEDLEGETNEAVASLKAHVRESLRQQALCIYAKGISNSTKKERALLSGLSLQFVPEWEPGHAPTAAVEAPIRKVRELAFLTADRERAPRLVAEVEAQTATALAGAHTALAAGIDRLSPALLRRLESAWPGGLPAREPVVAKIREWRQTARRVWFENAGFGPENRPEALQPDLEDDSILAALAARFNTTADRAQKAQILDCVCRWMTPEALPVLREMTREPWARDRALLNMTLRFGQPGLSSWENWLGWLSGQARLWNSEQEEFGRLIENHAQALLLILYSQVAEPEGTVLDSLAEMVCASGPPIVMADVLQTWSKWLLVTERRALFGGLEAASAAAAAPPPDAAQPLVPAGVGGPVAAAAVPPPPVAPTPPPRARPSVWENHIQPFFVENWYIVAGIAMVILGSSLLAYYTWDKHWLVRYTIMPALLALFTWSLAGAGSWLERKGAEFKGTAAILRGAAIGLLPINFMALALLSADAKVPNRGAAVPAMALIYLSLFGWGLRKWCAAVEPRLKNPLGGALLLLNALVAVGPLAQTVGHLEGRQLLMCLGAGFYLGFFVTAGTIVHFTRRILTREMAEEKRVPWFAATALAVTFVQVFVWVHGFMRHVPQAPTYALLVILAGWLVLYSERRALELKASLQLHGGESFLGFALVLLGLLMGFTQPAIRIVSFATAGSVWLYQGLWRRHPLHYWIALTLWVLAGASVGLLPRYPGAWLPILGVAMALGFELGNWTSQRRGLEELARTCRGMEAMVLALTALTAPLAQWHYRSQPLGTACWLAIVAALLGSRALRDRNLHWLHASMVVLALALPYAGFMDVAGGSVHHNTMVFGLALLSWVWLGLNWAAARGKGRAPRAIQFDNVDSPRNDAGQREAFGVRELAPALRRVAPSESAGKPDALQTLRAAGGPNPIPCHPGDLTSSDQEVPDGPENEAQPSEAHAGPGAGLRVPSLLLEARSTVLWFYGILAVAAMLLRVALGDTAPAPLWYRDCMDYTGPFLMMLALIAATYYSHSLAPAGMAVAIMAILFPELKANLQASTPWLCWGSGLGSACWALALAGLCFLLRPWSFLGRLPEADRFMGRESFPLGRADHTLFTWPIMAAALYLALKVDTWHLVQNWGPHGLALKTAAALGITAIAWTFIGIYHREHRAAVVCVHLGWFWMLAAISFAYWRLAKEPNWTWPVLATGLLLQCLYWFYRFRLEPARPWARALLTEPTRMVLLAASAGLAIFCAGCLLEGTSFEKVQWLCGFLAAQLIWHGLRTRRLVFGTILFFEVWAALLAATAPGPGPLWDRLSLDHSVSPTLWLLVGIQALFIVLEGARGVRNGSYGEDGSYGASGHARGAGAVVSGASLAELCSPVVCPALALASGLAVLLGVAGLADGVHWLGLSPGQQVLLLATLLLTARAQASAFILLPAMLLAYVMAHRSMLASGSSLEARFEVLLTPWRLAALGLGIVLLTQAGRWVRQRRPAFLAGPFAQPFFTAPWCGWLFWPAALLSSVAAILHTFSPVLREEAAQLWAPYAGVVTLALVARFWRRGLFLAGAGFLLLLGNIHLVRVFGGDFLRGHGLSELHLICLGLGLSLLQASVLRRLPRAGLDGGKDACATAISAINRASLGLAGLILALLTANYCTDPKLADITPTRFIVSGALAWLAGQYFRRAARHPGPGEEAHGDLCEGLYHFGMVLAIWCAALLAPWFRQPLFTLLALGAPAAYFYVRAELGKRAGLAEARRYRNSAAVLGFVVLGLYVFKAVFQVVLFPGTPIGTEYYHYNSPLILLLAIVLLRLHGLGGTEWLAFYGGLALMAASYFLLTALPGFSPFGYPMPGAWCALALGHFWIVASHARSPLRTAIQRLAKMDDAAWNSLRRSWGLFLAVAVQGVTLWGIADYSADTKMVAPLLAGAATILIHRGIIRRSPLSFVIAALELVAALHIDFLIPSYLPRDHVIWAVLGAWFSLLAAYRFLPGKLRPETVGQVALVSGALVLAHIFYHRPWSVVGLWGLGLGVLLGAWTPQRNREPANAAEKVFGALLLWAPVWLVFFSQAPFAVRGPEAAFEPWPILSAAMMAFLTGLFARCFPAWLAAGYRARPRSRFHLFDSTLTGLETFGPQIHQAILWLTLAVAGAAQVLHYQEAFAPREFALLILLEAGVAVAWFYEGRRRQSRLAYYLMQLAAAACFASARRHLMLTTGLWHYEYDVWASLAFSLAIAGAKQGLGLRLPALRAPLLTTLFLLPAMALVWVVVQGLSTDLALLVVGLHSVMFAYLGKDDRESPYNIVALAGFVSFILLTFYSKLHLRAVHAYIIPVGLGVLVLQELFQKRIKPDAANWIRLATLMAMLGSSGYYALADARHAITFNLTMILLCLLAMGLGSFLRIRLYLALGFAGLMTDLVSLLYKVLVLMERSARMTVVGSLVLLIGATLVFGAIYYKTNKVNLDALAAKLRLKLAAWQ